MSNRCTPKPNSREVITPVSAKAKPNTQSSRSNIGPAFRRGSTFDSSSTPDHNIMNTAFSLNSSSAKKLPMSIFSKLPTSLANSPLSITKITSASNLHKNVVTPKSLVKRKVNSYDHNLSEISFGTPKRSIRNRPKDISLNQINQNDVDKSGEEISNLSVAVRVRPMNSKELSKSSISNVIQVINNDVIVSNGSTADNLGGVTHSFQYDNVFWSCNSDFEHYANQEDVFKGTALPLVETAFEGYNACLFAYGQTGSGKSYSMMGIDIEDAYQITPNSDAGIIPRFCQQLFNRIDDLKGKFHAEVEVSYFEIYNEKIHDLLSVSVENKLINSAMNPNKKTPLRVREHPMWGPYIVDLSTHPVDTYTSLRNWLAVGNSQRATAATGMNDKSSRSHSIFNIVLNLTEINLQDDSHKPQTKRSKISLVDLAGSERVHTSHTCASGERLREGVSINKSLLTLGKVIAALAEAKKTSNFVPYRESVLTWLLRENLGGNSRTVMLATISPASIHLDETLATLRYACQARTIVNRVRVNEDPHDRIIRELRAEVERLHALQHDYERQKRLSNNAVNVQPRKIIIETSADENELEALRNQLKGTEQELKKAERSWMDRLKEAENVRKTEMRMLKKKGLALELSVEQKQPCLVNLTADPMLSGTLLYLIPLGIVKIGRSRPTAFSQPDIVLEGPLVAFEHCSIENINGKLFLIPETNDGFETFVNGELVLERRQIFHGDRLVIGGSHYFRVANPMCPKRMQNIVVDFQTAYQEIIQEQEKRLREELEIEKKLVLSEIEAERLANEQLYNEKIERLDLEKVKFNCSRELFEMEKNALNTKINLNQSVFEYHPFKSTILDDIAKIIKTRSKDSLHNIRLMCKEATQRCNDLGIGYEFKQVHIANETGEFRTIIKILDHDDYRTAEWQSAQLEIWLDRLRENDDEIEKENLFNCFDIDFKDVYNPDESCFNDSILNSSRASVNISLIKDTVMGTGSNPLTTTPVNNKSQNFSSNTTSKFNSSAKKTLFKEHKNENIPPSDSYYGHHPQSVASKVFDTNAKSYLKDMQSTVNKFRNLCKTNQSPSSNLNNRNFFKYCEEMEYILNEMRFLLNDNSNSNGSKSNKFLID